MTFYSAAKLDKRRMVLAWPKSECLLHLSLSPAQKGSLDGFVLDGFVLDLITLS